MEDFCSVYEAEVQVQAGFLLKLPYNPLMRRRWKALVAVVGTFVILAVLVLGFLLLVGNHFQRGERITEDFYTYSSLTDIPEDEIRSAISEYEASLEDNEGHDRAYLRLVWLHCALRDREGANHWADQAQQVVDDPLYAEILEMLRSHEML